MSARRSPPVIFRRIGQWGGQCEPSGHRLPAWGVCSRPAFVGVAVDLAQLGRLCAVLRSSYRSWLGAFVTSLVGTVLLTRDAARPAGARSAYAAHCCGPRCRIDSGRYGVYAGKQFGLLVAGAVLSVALFVKGAGEQA